MMLWRCCYDVMEVLLKCYGDVAMMLWRCCYGCYGGVAIVLWRCCYDVMEVLL